jgi:hypothetical protein
MTIQTYLDSRMAKVGSELADVERDLAGCIQPSDWTEFSARAGKKLDKAYAGFCSSIYWGIVRGTCGGLRSLRDGGGIGKPLQTPRQLRTVGCCPKQHGSSRNLLRMRPSLNGLYDYTNIALAPDRDRKGTGLSFV